MCAIPELSRRFSPYRLAAITRAELVQRRADLPPVPSCTIAEDRSPEVRARRGAELATLWHAGAGHALFAEPELAGAVDLFTSAQAGEGGEAMRARLAVLHQQIGNAIEAGEAMPRHKTDRNVVDRAVDVDVIKPG